MDYDQVTRNGNPRNPGRALYSHWLKILKLIGDGTNDEGRLHGGFNVSTDTTVSVVSHGKETGHSLRPNLELRYNWRTLFQLTAKGEFRIAQSYNGGWGTGGYLYRNLVAKHTFLRWSQVVRDYVWWVDTEATQGGYSYTFNMPDLYDFNNRIPYLSERALGAQDYGTEPHWMKLERVDDEWVMRFSRVYPCHSADLATQVKRDRLAHFEALREKRYHLAERKHLIDTGMLDPVTRRPPPTEEELAERRERDVQVLIAGMTVTQPARTRSLIQRTTEEVGLWEAPSGTR